MYIGDFELGSTIDFKFTTTAASTGAPTTLSGTPVISAYVGNSTTQITAGITLSVDFDAVTGLNNVRAVLTSGNGYAADTNIDFVITTGTVGGTSAVGYVVGRCSIGRASSYVRLGAPAGASVSADVAAVKTDTAAILVDTGTTLQAELDGIQADTEDIQTQIGAAGAGLTAVPWNAAWDAEVQSEVQDAIEANNLDHIVGTATAIPAVPAGTYLDQIMDDGTAAFDRTTDSLQAIRDHATTIKTETASILTDTAEIGAAGAGLSAVPWNASWDAEVQSEVADALAVYDPPTNAELVTEINSVQTDIAALNNLSAAQVNAEVVDALNTDTYAEPGQGAPAATATLVAKIGYLYKAWRNRTTQTATEYALYADDATTKDQEAAVSDDGTTLDRGEVTTGA